MSCDDGFCGTGLIVGGVSPPKPGDPVNTTVLRATPAFGGIDVEWDMPSVNPHAVAYTKLFRSTAGSNGAPPFSQATLHKNVSGGFFYDKVNTNIRYYYWIQFVTVNGTVLEQHGPASCEARPLIDDFIKELTGKIDSGVLAQSLKSELNKITLNYSELTNEIAARISNNQALAAAFDQVRQGITQSIGLIHTETTIRQNGQNALAQSISVIAAANAENAAAIFNERQARVTATGALAITVDGLNVASQDNAAAVKDVREAKIGYSVLRNTTIPFDGNGVTIVYPAWQYPAQTYPEYAINRTRIIDKVGVTNWNGLPEGQAKPLSWITGMPLATAVKSVQVQGPNGELATVEQTFQAQRDLNGGLSAMYGAKLNVNDLIGGFGLYNNGKIVEAGFDVDRFWVGRTTKEKKPFIIENDEVVINQAVINRLVFGKLRDEAGTVIVEDGKLKAEYIRVKNASIDNAAVDTLKIKGGSVMVGVFARTPINQDFAVPASGQLIMIHRTIPLDDNFTSGLMITGTVELFTSGPGGYIVYLYVNSQMIGRAGISMHAGYDSPVTVQAFADTNLGTAPYVELVIVNVNEGPGSNVPATARNGSISVMAGKR